MPENQTAPDRIGTNAWILIISIWLLMVFTFSPPEDWKQGQYGTQTILPPQVIKLLKLVSRVTSLGLLGFAAFRLMRHPAKGRIMLLFAPVAVFTFWIFASVYWSPLRTVSLQQAISFAVSVLLAFVFAASWKSEKDTSIYLANISIVLVCISTGLLVLYCFAPQYGALTKVASGMFHSTTAGASASLGIIGILGAFGTYRWSWSRNLLIPALAVHLPVLIIAGNRWSIVLTILFSTIVVIMFFRKHELALVSVTAAVVGLGYLAIDPKLNGPDFAVKKVETYVLQGQSKVQFNSISGRTEMWSVMWDSFLQSPWLGHGYFVTSKTGRIHVWDEWGNWTAHNMYLQVLVTSGVIGFILFLFSMVVPFFGFIHRQTASHSHSRSFLTLLLLMGIWFFAWGMLNSAVVGPTQPETVVFAFVYGMGIKALSQSWEKFEHSQNRYQRDS